MAIHRCGGFLVLAGFFTIGIYSDLEIEVKNFPARRHAGAFYLGGLEPYS
jgi:hypothetical protein